MYVSDRTTATITYIRGASETITRILRPYNIRVTQKPMFTLRRLLTNVKGKDKPQDRPGAAYKIKYSACEATYIGETSRNLIRRLTERKRAVTSQNGQCRAENIQNQDVGPTRYI